VNLQAASDSELPARLSELAKAARAARQLQGGGAAEQQAAAPRHLRRNLATEGVTAACKRVNETVGPALEADGANPELVVKKLAEVLEVTESEATAVTKKTAIDLAAAAQAELDQRRAERPSPTGRSPAPSACWPVQPWELYLLHVVGLRGDQLTADGVWTGDILSAAGFRHMLDLLVTGLAIGGGTKPLHDLITNLQAAKYNRKDPRPLQ
jgi:hypothetical protein